MQVKTIDVATLKAGLDKNEVLLIDVREEDEHVEARIPGNVLIPLGQVSLSALPDAGGRKLVMQCRSGGRSLRACEQLLQENPDLEVYNLEGGILAWVESGYPVERG